VTHEITNFYLTYFKLFIVECLEVHQTTHFYFLLHLPAQFSINGFLVSDYVYNKSNRSIWYSQRL